MSSGSSFKLTLSYCLSMKFTLLSCLLVTILIAMISPPTLLYYSVGGLEFLTLLTNLVADICTFSGYLINSCLYGFQREREIYARALSVTESG